MSAESEPFEPRRRTSGRGPVLLAGAVGLAGLLLLRLRDPHAGGSYGLCPFHELTGLWCPLCGGLRATNDLTRLQVGDAVSSNVLATCIVVGGAGYFLYWAATRWRGRRVRTFVVGGRAGLALVAVAVGFTVVRNTPFGAFLAP